MNLLNIQLDFLAGALLKLSLQLIDLRAALADHNPRLSSEDCDLDLVRRALDFNARYTGIRQLTCDCSTQHNVFVQLIGVRAISKPFRLPILDIAQTEANRMYFTSHLNLLAVVHDHRDVSRALANMISAATSARHEALERRALIGIDSLDDQISRLHLKIIFGVGCRRLNGSRNFLGGFL